MLVFHQDGLQLWLGSTCWRLKVVAFPISLELASSLCKTPVQHYSMDDTAGKEHAIRYESRWDDLWIVWTQTTFLSTFYYFIKSTAYNLWNGDLPNLLAKCTKLRVSSQGQIICSSWVSAISLFFIKSEHMMVFWQISGKALLLKGNWCLFSYKTVARSPDSPSPMRTSSVRGSRHPSVYGGGFWGIVGARWIKLLGARYILDAK